MSFRMLQGIEGSWDTFEALQSIIPVNISKRTEVDLIFMHMERELMMSVHDLWKIPSKSNGNDISTFRNFATTNRNWMTYIIWCVACM